MKNLPEKVYLVLGEIQKDEVAHLDFNDLQEVTWSTQRIFENDVEYALNSVSLKPSKYCDCAAPIPRGVNPEYCGNCGKDINE